MATTVQRRDVASSVQTAAAGSSIQTILSVWNQADAGADNAQNRTAIVDLYIEGRGAATGKVNAYHRREVFFLGYNRTLARDVGSLLAAVEEVEEMATADAVLSLSTPSTAIMTLTGPTGGDAEIVDWSWEGTITITSVPWENPYNILGDLSTNKYQGTMNGMEIADILTDSPGVGTTHSTQFEGVNEYVTMGNVLNFLRTDPFSVSFWFKTVSAATGFVVAKIVAAAPTGWGVAVGSTGLVAFQLINTFPTKWINAYTTLTGFNDGNWHHAVATWDGDATPGAAGAQIYVDDSTMAMSIASDTLAANTISNAAGLDLGRRQSDGTYYVGQLCHVAIYNKELTAAEVTAIYNAGAPPDLLTLASAANLVYWNRMGD
jgi:hypothetical protein